MAMPLRTSFIADDSARPSSNVSLALVRAFFAPTVLGRTRWYARYIEQGLCRLKWLSAAAIPLWLVQAMGLTHRQRYLFDAAAATLQTTPEMLIYGSLSVAIVVAAFILVSARRSVRLEHARWLVRMGVIVPIVAEGLILGFSHASFERAASFDLALLVVLATAPVLTTEATLLAMTGLVVVIASAGLSGMPLTTDVLTFSLHPASFAVLGIVVNHWYRGVFKNEWIGSLRLSHKGRQLSRQKLEIEKQKDEAVRQQELIARHQDVLVHALASALTAPVAQSYVAGNSVRTEMRNVCVIACDAVGFSETCRKLHSGRIVTELREFFRAFDAACFRYRVEPLRAQGDSRIAIAGLWPQENRPLHQDAISAVLAMLVFRRALPSATGLSSDDPGAADILWPARIGISIGSVACGVIDTCSDTPDAVDGRLWFDVWGDTVNLAARLQEAARPNQILVREGVLWETCGLFDHGSVQQYHIKNTTLSDAVEVIGIRKEYCDDCGEPNAAFWEKFNDPRTKPVKPNPAGTGSTCLGNMSA